MGIEHGVYIVYCQYNLGRDTLKKFIYNVLVSNAALCLWQADEATVCFVGNINFLV